MEKVIVLTTINPPKGEIQKLSSYKGWRLVCVGDNITPKDWKADAVEYLSPELQSKLFPKFSEKFPWRMYARKNLGYLYAIKQGAGLIYETDDDMMPLWEP